MTDRRKKGCPNEHCVQHIDKVKHSSEIDYCPKCGTKLIFVCAKCLGEIEDIAPKHSICIRCKAEAAEKRAQTIDKGKDILKNYVAAPIIGAVVTVVAATQKEAVNKVVEKVPALINNVVNIVLKK